MHYIQNVLSIFQKLVFVLPHLELSFQPRLNFSNFNIPSAKIGGVYQPTSPPNIKIVMVACVGSWKVCVYFFQYSLVTIYNVEIIFLN